MGLTTFLYHISFASHLTFMMIVFLIFESNSFAKEMTLRDSPKSSLRPYSIASKNQFKHDSTVNRHPQNVLLYPNLENIFNDIRDDVRNMNIGDPTRGDLPILEYAGSHALDSLMYLSEARIHYPKLVALLEGSPGYLHSGAMIPGVFSPTASGSQDLADLLRDKFSRGAVVVSMIFGVQNHYVVLAIQKEGRIAFIDSLAGYAPLQPEQQTHLLSTLNSSRIINEKGELVVFRNIELISTHQQKDASNCLIFATLNAFQIAKTGTIEGYQDVTASLSSGTLRTYEDIARIGQERALPVPSYTDDQIYQPFMQSFRRQTQNLIAEVVGIDNINQNFSNNSTAKSSSGLLFAPVRSFPIVAGKICSNHSMDLISHCTPPNITVSEDRGDLVTIPYRTIVSVKPNLNCHHDGNKGMLQIEVFDKGGDFVKYEKLDYLNNLKTSIELPKNKAIGSIKVGTKTPHFFETNRYPLDCVITILVELNMPTATSSQEAEKIRSFLNQDLKRNKDHFEALSMLSELKNSHTRVTGFFDTLASKIFGTRTNEATLLSIDVELLTEIVNDSTGRYDPEIQHLLSDIKETIELAKKKSSTQTTKNYRDFLTDDDRKRILDLESKLSPMIHTSEISASKRRLDQASIRYHEAIAMLSVFDDKSKEREIIERELLRIFQEEITGSEGLVAKIRWKLKQQGYN